jgi:hypothetical protein
LNDEEILYKEPPQEINIVEKSHTQSIDVKENIREICIGNIPKNLSNDKLYEIFFIFGDISKIEYVREQVRS